MIEIGEPLIIKAAQRLGMKGIDASFASDSLSIVLQKLIKKMPKEELVEILKNGGINVTKQHIGVPTTRIKLEVGENKKS